MEKSGVDGFLSFGDWVQQRRKALSLTQADLAQQVGCAVITIKKIEQDSRKPSQQMAALLAKHLAIPDPIRENFLKMAQGKYIPGTHLSDEVLRVPSFLRPGKFQDQKLGSQIVGRQTELVHLRAYLEQALNGNGKPIFILGEAGSGKTTLMAEFARQALDRNATLLVAGGQCNAQTGVGDPYRPFRDILGALTGDLEASWLTDELSSDHLLRMWISIPDILQSVSVFGPNLVDILLPLTPFLQRVTPYLAGPTDWLDQIRSLSRAERSGKPDMDQTQLIEEITRVFKDIATRHPLLLILDDLQWVDDASINLLFHLCRRLKDSRILLVGAFRPDENDSGKYSGEIESFATHPLESLVLELTRQYGNNQINLDFLNQVEGKLFVDAVIDRYPNHLGKVFRDNLLLQTRGQPLFTMEMLQSLQESGKLIQDDSGSWIENPQPVPDQIPPRIEAVIAQRLNRLKPGLLEMLNVACVEGLTFTAELIAEILRIDLHSVLKQLSRDLGQQHRLIHEIGEVQAGPRRLNRFQFNHLLFQEYLENRLSPGEKRWNHREVAYALEKLWGHAADELPQSIEDFEPQELNQLDLFGPQLVHHFFHGEVWEKAAAYAILMGKHARRRFAMREAITYFELALNALSHLADPSDQLYAAILGWEDAAFKFKSYDEQLSWLLKAEQIARQHQDRPKLIQALHWTANVHLSRGLWTRAGPALVECLDLAEALDNEQLSVRPVFFKGLMASFVDPRSSLIWFDRALDLAIKYKYLDIQALALGSIGQVYAQTGEFAKALEVIETARQTAGRLGSPLTESDVDLLTGWSFLAMGQPEESLTWGLRSVEKAAATDNMDCLCNALACVGYGNLELRRLPDAESAFENGIEHSKISGAVIPKLNGQAGLAMAHFFNGREDAIKDLESALSNMLLYEHVVGAANVNHMLGSCFLQLGIADRAETHLNNAVKYYRQSQMYPFLARTLRSETELLEKQGRHIEALQTQKEAETLYTLFDSAVKNG